MEENLDSIISGAGKIKFAEPNPFLYNRIKQQIENQKSQPVFSKSTIRLAIAGLAILCVLNIIVLFSVNGEQPAKEYGNSLDIFSAGNE